MTRKCSRDAIVIVCRKDAVLLAVRDSIGFRLDFRMWLHDIFMRGAIICVVVGDGELRELILWCQIWLESDNTKFVLTTMTSEKNKGVLEGPNDSDVFGT